MKDNMADGISRWLREELTEKVRELTNITEWVEQDIGKRECKIYEIVLRTKNIIVRHDVLVCKLMVTGQDSV